MPDTTEVVIDLATGLEDAERATVAFLVAGAAVERGMQVTNVPDQGEQSESPPPATPRRLRLTAAR